MLKREELEDKKQNERKRSYKKKGLKGTKIETKNKILREGKWAEEIVERDGERGKKKRKKNIQKRKRERKGGKEGKKEKIKG